VLCFYDHLAPKSLEHVALRISPSDRWGLSEASMAVGKNGTPYYERVGAGLMFLSLKSLIMYNLKVCVREISGMYRLYVCVWHPISRTCCVKNQPLARMERRFARHLGAWGAGVGVFVLEISENV
jgi:hypothetical protein